MRSIPLDQRLSEKVTGGVAVTEEKLETRLGATAYLLWQALCVCRDKNGFTTVTHEGLKRLPNFQTPTKDQIRRGLARLRAAGLVRNLAKGRRQLWRMKGRGKNAKRVKVWAMPRVVYGCKASSPRGIVVLVPPQTATWLNKANTHGGHRKQSTEEEQFQRRESWKYRDAIRRAVTAWWNGEEVGTASLGFPDYPAICKHLGPPPSPRATVSYIQDPATWDLTDLRQVRKAFRPENHQWKVRVSRVSGQGIQDRHLDPPCRNAPKNGSEISSRMVKMPPVTEDQDAAPNNIVVDLDPSCCTTAYAVVQRAADAARAADTSKPRKPCDPDPDLCISALAAPPIPADAGGAGSTPPAKKAQRVKRLDPKAGTEVSSPTLGTGLIGGQVGTQRPPIPGTGGVPPFPTGHNCPSATVPSAPLLPDDLKGLEAAAHLAKIYRAAISKKYKERCGVLAKRGQLAKSRVRPRLEEAAEILWQHEVPPAAWAAWSIEVWRSYKIGKGKAPLSWVYSPNRIEEHLGWFQSEGARHCAPRAIYSRVAKDFIERYQVMRLTLVQRQAITPAEVAEVVQMFFPGNDYERWSQAARKAAASDQELINRAVARGEYVW